MSLLRLPLALFSALLSALFFASFLALTVSSCTRVDWVPIEEPSPELERPLLDIEGALCTARSDELSYPLRVLFLVDSSVSMAVSDPVDPESGLSRRQRAVRQTWRRLLEESDGDSEVKIGIVRFSAQAQPLTAEDLDGDGLVDSFFSDDPVKLEEATEALAFTDRSTNYLNVLSEAYVELRKELLDGEREALGRSRYLVIFLSDGLPSDGANSRRGEIAEQISEKIDELRYLQELFGVGEISLHTLFIATEEGLRLDEEAQTLLTAMAERGGGSYRSVPNGEELDFLHIGFSRLRRLYSLKALSLIPLSWVQDDQQRPELIGFEGDEGAWLDADQDGELDCGEPMRDSDRDGLADIYERRLGTDPFHPDSDGDGLRDRVEWSLRRSGLSPLDPYDGGCLPLEEIDGECADENEDGYCDCPDDDEDGSCDLPDSDGDGLNDCEELFIGSLNGDVDSDGDGFPDLLEFRFGSSPQQADGRGDIDWDGTEDSVELLGGYDPRCDDSATRSRVGYARSLEERGVEGEQVCYDFALRRVLLVPSPDQKNRLLLFAGEGGFDEAARISRWRAACVDVDVDEEGIGRGADEEGLARLTLSDADFHLVSELDLSQDCVSQSPAPEKE